MPAVIAIFTGPAGSGKTSLVKGYSDWIKANLFLKVGVVNLDPGAEILNYSPVFDIRNIFTLSNIMERYNLGPNGAFIKASDLLLENINEILSSPPFSRLSEWDIILVDTPGQMEAFLFRPVSSVFFRELGKLANTVVVYIVDASSLVKVSDAVFLWLLYILLQLKTGLTTVPVINKRDIAANLKIAKLLVENPLGLLKEVEEEGLAHDIVPELVNIALKTRGPFRAVLVSAKELEDMKYLHALLHEAFCTCGDLT
ncbi:MAG: ATP/GTP-binding protein [Desulfurococcaceae archaeon]